MKRVLSNVRCTARLFKLLHLLLYLLRLLRLPVAPSKHCWHNTWYGRNIHMLQCSVIHIFAPAAAAAAVAACWRSASWYARNKYMLQCSVILIFEPAAAAAACWRGAPRYGRNRYMLQCSVFTALHLRLLLLQLLHAGVARGMHGTDTCCNALLLIPLHLLLLLLVAVRRASWRSGRATG
jgi:hypothetical protein